MAGQDPPLNWNRQPPQQFATTLWLNGALTVFGLLLIAFVGQLTLLR